MKQATFKCARADVPVIACILRGERSNWFPGAWASPNYTQMRPLRHGRWAMERVAARNRITYLKARAKEENSTLKKMFSKDAVWWEVVLGQYIPEDEDDWYKWWNRSFSDSEDELTEHDGDAIQ